MKNNKRDEELRIENEIMKLKLTAQYGDQFQMHSFEEMPAEMENQFLKRIIAFEEQAAMAEVNTVYEKLGKPSFKLLKDIPATEIKTELQRLMDLMEAKNILLHFTDGPYEDEIIYKFITEEFFNKDAGMFNNFIYEEYHPNHKADITKNTHRFIMQWFKRSFNEFSYELGFEFTLPTGEVLSRDEMISRINAYYEAYPTFKSDAYNIDDVQYELHDGAGEDVTGFGFCEGAIKYEAIMENGELVNFEGPYKFYMSYSGMSWSIFYFVMPGFNL